jgi:hypothetical protein
MLTDHGRSRGHHLRRSVPMSLYTDADDMCADERLEAAKNTVAIDTR